MIGIIDYDAGNLQSVCNALNYLGINSKIVKTALELECCEKLILPGVGAFPAAVESLKSKGLFDEIRIQAKKKPIFGICLGMQLLFSKSYEFGECEGLGLVPGSVVPINSCGFKIPHMGWNELVINFKCELIKNLNSDRFVYFVHSFRAECDYKYVSCFSEYSEKIPAIIRNGNIYGAQFHPEKSSYTGLSILKSFSEVKN